MGCSLGISDVHFEYKCVFDSTLVYPDNGEAGTMFIMSLGVLALLASLPDTIETRITFTTDDFTFQEVQSLDFISAENTYAIGREGYHHSQGCP